MSRSYQQQQQLLRGCGRSRNTNFSRRVRCCSSRMMWMLLLLQSALWIAAAGGSAHTPPYGGTTGSSSSSSSTIASSSSSSSPPTAPPQQQQQQQQQTLPRSNNRRYSHNSDKNKNKSSSSSYSLYNHNNDDHHLTTPWNSSPHIDQQTGFLQGLFVRTPGYWEQEEQMRTRHTLEAPCRIRQVPGDGNCLFHSISLCLCEAVNGTQWNLLPSSAASASVSDSSSGSRSHSGVVTHGGGAGAGGGGEGTVRSGSSTTKTTRQPPPPSLPDLYAQSHKLRADAVACLRDGRRRLILQGRDRLRADDLVQAAAQQYGMTPEDYCQAMQQDCVWGGGPEIVALCNLLQRPIHVYELATADAVDLEQQQQQPNKNSLVDPSSSSSSSWDENRRRWLLQQRGATGCGTTGFVLRRMACFGSPKFDRHKALHILSADSRFPDLVPGQQLPAGNHFLAVFPDEGLLLRQSQNDDDSDDSGRRRSLWRKRRKRLRGGDCIDNNSSSSCSKHAVEEKDGIGGSGDNKNGKFAGIEVSSNSFLKRAQSKCRHWWSSVWLLL